MRNTLRGGGRFGGGSSMAAICGPNVTSRQGGMQGMGFDWGSIDWTSLGTQLIGTAGDLVASNQPQPQAAPVNYYYTQPAAAPAAAKGDNTALYIILGVLGVAGVGFLAYKMAKKK